MGKINGRSMHNLWFPNNNQNLPRGENYDFEMGGNMIFDVWVICNDAY